MPDKAMSIDEKKWQAESDARTLSEAAVIKKDTQRLRAAVNAARRMYKEKKIEAAAMEKIAKLTPSARKKARSMTDEELYN